MKVNVIDKEKIAINEIKNIEIIEFGDLSTQYIDNTKTALFNELLENGNCLIIPMLTVFYDGSKVITLCSTDRNFNYLVKKVREVYLKEKDIPIPGSPIERYIQINEKSKKILLSDSITQTSDLYKYYNDKDSYNELLFSQDKEFYALIPLLEHIIKSNLSNINKNFKLDTRMKGYGPSGNYILYGKINNEYMPIPIIFKRSNKNNYTIQVGNIFGNFNPLNILININKTSLDIISKVESIGYLNLESYKYKERELIRIKETFVQEKCVYEEINKYEKTDIIPAVSKIDEDDTLDWFEMPWGGKLGFNYNENIIDDESKIVYKKIQYIDDNRYSFINLESAEKRFIRKSQDYRKVKDIIFDDVDKTMIGFKDEDLIFISTNFGDDGAVGEYKEKYANKYFYHISTAENFDSISKSNTFPIKKDYSIYSPGDLTNNYEIKALVKGM